MVDISNWPLDKIMQLPDHAFGRRWIIGIKRTIPPNQTEYHLIGQKLPDILILWQLFISCKIENEIGGIVVGIRYADEVATDDTSFQRGERMFPSHQSQSLNYDFRVSNCSALNLNRLKTPIRTVNRRISLRLQEQDADSVRTQILFTVSSVPKEVPEWIVSG